MKTKKDYLIILMMVLFSFQVNSQSWTWINPTFTGNHLNSVSIVNDSCFYVGGEYNTILKITNSGSSVNYLPSPVRGNTTLIKFFDEMKGYIIHNYDLYKTTNGGNSWTKIIESDTIGFQFPYFFAINENILYTIQYSNYDKYYLLKTTNGGNSWDVIYQMDHNTSNPSSAFNLNDLFFINENKGFFVSIRGAGDSCKIYKTIDGGLNWSEISTIVTNDANFYPHKIFFTNDNFGYIKINKSAYITTDGGYTWTELNNILNYGSGDVYFINENIGYAIEENKIKYSNDVGLTWTDIYNNLSDPSNPYSSPIPFRSANFNSNYFFAVGENGTIIKINVNTNETIKISPNFIQGTENKWIKDILFTSQTNGFFVGGTLYSKGFIYKTSDGGNTWTKVYDSPNNALNAIHFIDNNYGFVVGEKSILKTTDGGNTWINTANNLNQRFYGVYFINQNHGFVVGYSGAIETTDGGNTWTPLNFTQGSIYNVRFLNANTGFMAGENGKLYKTTNGGNTWATITVDSIDYLYDVYFTDENNGVVSGAYSIYQGKIYKTSDGGQTWTTVLTSPGPRFYKFSFVGNNGYAVGDMGTFIKTTDGGYTWTDVWDLNPTHNNLSSCYFLSSNVGFIVGERGSIIKTNNGGEIFIPYNHNIFNSMIIYPCPAQDILTISVDNNYSYQQYLCEIYNLQGQILFSKLIKEFPETINVSSLTNGVYILKLSNKDGVINKKFIKN